MVRICRSGVVSRRLVREHENFGFTGSVGKASREVLATTLAPKPEPITMAW
jgi:hypothetical protein